MIRVRGFGRIGDLLGARRRDVEVGKESVQLKELFKVLRLTDGRTLYDYVAEGDNINEHIMVFINGVRVPNKNGLNFRVKDGDEVVITPPVSAGGMVDISRKDVVYREAEAEGTIILKKSTVKMILEKAVEKGDVLEAAKIAALNAVKLTPNLLAYCHPVNVTGVEFYCSLDEDRAKVRVRVKAIDRTGVEMEALTAVSIALLTIWDMVKKYEKDEKGEYPFTKITDIRVNYKVKGPI